MHGRKAAFLMFFVLLSPLVTWPRTALSQDNNDDPLNIYPTDRVEAEIDDSQRFSLNGNVHPLARPENLVGEVSPSQPMERMVLVLGPDVSQPEALEELIRAQQDPASRYYHQWITPEAFGEHYGISESDLAQVADWLEMHGMKVDEVPSSRRAIVFSGTAGQVESTFHTSMQKYSVRGEAHYANASDPEIPQALAEVVQGVVSLHDFRSAALHEILPAFTVSSSVHYLAPLDWDAIYDVEPLASQGLDGSGQSIAVVGRSDITMSDVATFRSNFGLPAKNPTIITNGPDPGIPDSGDEIESTLDVEWAGAIAKNVSVKFVTSRSTATDGIALSSAYVVSKNVAPIITVSYGVCEAALGSSGNAFWNGLWAQAASQGQSVFVAAGDSGAAGCDNPNSTTATHGRGVNGMCSTPYSTCVGGTEFNDTANPGVYWGSTNGGGGVSALGYIPEFTWNQSSSTSGLWATGGGASSVCAKPSWQAAPGVPGDKARDVPDVAVAASTHDAYLIQLQGNTVCIGGTSAAAPSFASVIALILQNSAATQGNINPVLYSLANQQLSADGPLVFPDISGGNNSVPGVQGYNAGAGYDFATGLGSIDAFLLVKHWSGRSASTFTMASSASNVSVGQGKTSSVTLSESVEGGFSSPVTLSVTGAPTGMKVSFSSPTLTSTAPVTATIAAGSSEVASTYTLTFAGTGGGLTRTLSLSVTVTAPSFTLTPSTATASEAPGGTAAITLTTTLVNGFSSAIALAVSGPPSGVTASFTHTSIATPGSGSSTLTLSASSAAKSGTSTLFVTAVGGGVTQTQIIPFTITQSPSFTLATNAASASVARGGSVSITVTTTAGSGFSPGITLSVSGLPSGVKATLAPASIASPGTGTSILRITVGSGAAAGTSTLTVTATGGGVTKTQAISLAISAATGKG